MRDTGSAIRLLALPSGRFSSVLGREAAAARRDPDRAARARRLLVVCRERAIAILALGSPMYPRELLALVDPPSVLFLRGDRGALARRRVAVVGSRRSTASGRRTAERLSRDLSTAGIAVVSGLALGIDGAAHRGALAGSGGTVAVLGSGVDRAQPTAHRALFERILETGLVVSEFPPGEIARPYHFPRRNRVLAALSSAVVVVEAGRRSGALITVDHALDLGLDVFAVPGSVESAQSVGTNALLREGAHVATSAEDVMSAMGWEPSGAGSRPLGEGPQGADEAAVAGELGSSPLGLDRLVAAAGIPAPRALAALTRLEMTGVARRTQEGWIRALR